MSGLTDATEGDGTDNHILYTEMAVRTRTAIAEHPNDEDDDGNQDGVKANWRELSSAASIVA